MRKLIAIAICGVLIGLGLASPSLRAQGVDPGVSALIAAINLVTGAIGSAPSSRGVYLAAKQSGATSGLLAGLIACDLHASYDASDAGSITMVTGISGRKVKICGYKFGTGVSATNLKLREGSDANCATNGGDLTPAYQLSNNQQDGALTPFWSGLQTSTTGYYVCINASAANAHQAEVWYSVQ